MNPVDPWTQPIPTTKDPLIDMTEEQYRVYMEARQPRTPKKNRAQRRKERKAQ